MKWSTIKIGDIGRIVTGNTPPKNRPEFYGDAYKFIKPTDMEIGMRFTLVTEEYYSDEGYKKYESALIPPYSTCVVTIGSLGKKMTLTDNYCFTNQAVNAVIPDKYKFDPFFVFYALKNILNKVKAADTGASSGRENVSKSNFASLTLEVPNDLPTQQKIASILSAYDDLIENNLRRIRLLEEAAQHLYREWFVHLRFPGYEHTPVVNGLPEGWERRKLQEVTIVVNRGISPQYVEDDGFIVINQKCVRDGLVSYQEARLTSNQKKISNEKLLRDYDILVNSTGTGTLGRVAQVVCVEYQQTVDSHVTIIRANPNIISPVLLGYVVKEKENFIAGLGRGATNQTELSREDLKELIEVLLPLKPLQEQFENIAKPILKNIYNLQKQNQALKEARDILLPRLMNQTIRL